jgi:predicted ATP-binding protein involved in virulence
VLLQRLYDVYGPEQPRNRHALVLIDEIDAHMHPAWQQSIVHHLQVSFPNLQVVATTHSPLMVAGRSREEVLIFERAPETGMVSVTPSPISFKGLRSDQILTSLAFGLSGARDYETTRKQNRYRELIEKAERNDEENAEFEALRSDDAIIARRLGESPLQARAYEVIRDAIDATLAEKTPAEEKELRAEIDSQLKEALLESEKR